MSSKQRKTTVKASFDDDDKKNLKTCRNTQMFALLPIYIYVLYTKTRSYPTSGWEDEERWVGRNVGKEI